VDMKNMDAMIITALQDILGGGGQPQRDLIVAFFSDEENGGVFGSHYIVENRPDLFAGAGEALSEIGGYSPDLSGRRSDVVQTREKALVWVRLVARGTAADGSRVIRDNAVTERARAVAAFGGQEWPVQLTATTAQLGAAIAALMGLDPDGD